MRILLIPPRANYPNPGHSLDHLPQSYPYIAAALAGAGHEVSGLTLSYAHDPDLGREPR